MYVYLLMCTCMYVCLLMCTCIVYADAKANVSVRGAGAEEVEATGWHGSRVCASGNQTGNLSIHLQTLQHVHILSQHMYLHLYIQHICTHITYVHTAHMYI
eukprot:GHVS01081185.1.p2 GENE.GHVS01081185.1~~GHVS01081185.1.p2  ORF type:complete len:101 (-),score=1.41 GHVS01081185.1:102-404(-)